MAKFVATCPGCRRKFPWDVKLGYPSRCPLPDCDYTTEDTGEIVIAAPFIKTNKSKVPDASYRALEAESNVRAEQAASLLNCSVAEVSHLKVTNIKDNVHEGESYAMPVVNDVTRQMDMIRQRGGRAGFGAGGEEYFSGVNQGAVTLNGKPIANGVVPNAGAHAQKLIRGHHERHNPGATSDRPALETLQPGYRSRV